MDLKEERNMILDMVAEGKITVEEAKQLLDALEQSVRENEPDDDFFVAPNIDFQMPKMPDISRIVNRATKRASRHARKMPRVFYDMDDLSDIRDNLEEEVERLREEMEEMKEEARRVHEEARHVHEEEKNRLDEEDWDE